MQLDSGADLLALDELDQKLWVALSCPTRGIEFDGRTLDMIERMAMVRCAPMKCWQPSAGLGAC